jgi:class 3 adenylate cyclase
MPPRPIHTFVFADLVGFTVYTAVHGDEAGADLATGFAGQATRIAAEYGAELVKSIGDAVLIRGTDAAESVRLGLQLSTLAPAPPWCSSVRVGMHTGPAVQRDTGIGTGRP